MAALEFAMLCKARADRVLAKIKVFYKSVPLLRHKLNVTSEKVCNRQTFFSEIYFTVSLAGSLTFMPIPATLKRNWKLRLSAFAGGRFYLESMMTEAEILSLVDRLEHCLLAKDEFHHRDHLAVAAAYLYAGDSLKALERMRASLKRFAAHHGVSNLYHETLTRFWLLQVQQRLDRRLPLSESVRTIQEELADKDLPLKFYSKELLNSAEARAEWIEPDLKA